MVLCSTLLECTYFINKLYIILSFFLRLPDPWRSGFRKWFLTFSGPRCGNRSGANRKRSIRYLVLGFSLYCFSFLLCQVRLPCYG